MNRRHLAAVAAIISISPAGCSGSAGGATASAQPSTPVSTPKTYVCRGFVYSSTHDFAPIVIHISPRRTPPMRDGYNWIDQLTVSPASFSLDPSHPSRRLTIEQPGYTGGFGLSINDCVFALRTRWLHAHGPRVTLIIGL